ncbi:MAG TPA: lipid A biosynthesis acyltransferase [Burkholderiales bacterium]|nr:lipid A biosynthesis acyltransferase [Burkholderiales bacterium]
MSSRNQASWPARAGLALLWLLARLPAAWLSAVGSLLGGTLFLLARERRRVCLTNLERCMPELAEHERHALARAHFRCYAQSLLERGVLWWAPRAVVLERVALLGLEHLQAARGTGNSGGPVILLAPHFVGLDAGWTRLACELDMASVYAKQKSAAMSEALYRGRMRFGRQRLFSRQEGIRPALAALKQGLPFYYLPDMDYGPRDALFVPFFGVPAATITGLTRLARLAGAAVVPCVTRRLAGGRYEVRCYPAWDNYPTDDIEADTRRMNAYIEDRVREMPEQYLWTHKRFKTRPSGAPRWY